MSGTNEFKLPKRVADAIAEYQKHIAVGEAAAERVRARNVELTAELSTAEAELEAAMDRTIADPTPTNERKETELRRKVAELTMQVAGGVEREQRARQSGSGKERELRIAAATIGKEEAVRYFDENYDEVLEKIAAAKGAYLQSLVGYYDLQRNANNIWRQSSMGAENFDSIANAVGGHPNFREKVFTNRLGAPNHGIFEDEIRQAAGYGNIY